MRFPHVLPSPSWQRSPAEPLTLFADSECTPCSRLTHNWFVVIQQNANSNPRPPAKVSSYVRSGSSKDLCQPARTTDRRASKIKYKGDFICVFLLESLLASLVAKSCQALEIRCRICFVSQPPAADPITHAPKWWIPAIILAQSNRIAVFGRSNYHF